MTRARKIVGRLSFVGAGPGDPELLSRRAVELVSAAEIVFADTDVPESITALIRGEHRPVTAGRRTPRPRGPRWPRPAPGSVVVRLVTGDPFTADEVVREVLAAARTDRPGRRCPGRHDRYRCDDVRRRPDRRHAHRRRRPRRATGRHRGARPRRPARWS